jgi:hypothetical protein
MVAGTILRKLSISKCIYLCLGLTLLAGCKGNRWDIDTKDIKAEVKVQRFDQALFTIDTNNWEAGIAKLRNNMPEIYEAYVGPLLQIGPPKDLATAKKLKTFIADKYWRELYADVQKQFGKPQIDSLETELEDAFKHYKYYYPGAKIPRVYTVVKGFNPVQIIPSIFTFEDALGISLEMYLGENYKYYQGWPLYGDYQLKRFRREYILPQALKTMFSARYDQERLEDNVMLSKMIYAGKMLLFVEAMDPDMPDSLRFEYTQKQVNWCKENEVQMWEHFIKNELLYTTDQYKQDKYLTDAPFTAAENVPPESAPRLGEWIGYRIVQKYMEENPDVSLDELMRDKDYRKILQKSKYKPK